MVIRSLGTKVDRQTDTVAYRSRCPRQKADVRENMNHLTCFATLQKNRVKKKGETQKKRENVIFAPLTRTKTKCVKIRDFIPRPTFVILEAVETCLKKFLICLLELRSHATLFYLLCITFFCLLYYLFFFFFFFFYFFLVTGN